MQTIQIRWLLPLSFFIGICYIIFLADTADHNFAFMLVGHVPYGDKIAHALLYGMMALLLNYGLGFRRGRLPSHRFKPFLATFGVIVPQGISDSHLTPYIGSVIVLILATLEEFSQYFIPSRTFDMWDLLADFVGVVLFSIWRINK